MDWGQPYWNPYQRTWNYDNGLRWSPEAEVWVQPDDTRYVYDPGTQSHYLYDPATQMTSVCGPAQRYKRWQTLDENGAPVDYRAPSTGAFLTLISFSLWAVGSFAVGLPGAGVFFLVCGLFMSLLAVRHPTAFRVVGLLSIARVGYKIVKVARRAR